MTDIDHPLERRAKLLAGRLTQRMDLIKMAVAPPGQRLPFTQQLSKPAALAFWKDHRHDATGAKILGNMRAEDILELDTALAMAGEGGQDSGFSG